ncbi:MAG: glutaredoxin family protein [Chloroflexota bacterium]
MMQLTLYTKESCSLCDKLKSQLETHQERFPHQLREVDITQDDVLFEKYRFTIPVLQSGDSKIEAPIDEQKLEAFLEGLA